MKRTTKKWLNAMVGALAALLCASAAQASQVRLDVAPSSDLMLAGQKQTVFLKVGLTGLEIERASSRTPVNVAIVLDRSGSMSGEKIEKAREAAKMAVGLLRSDDIVSIVAYNHSVDVLVPATKVFDKREIYRQIDRLVADGSTALFAGVSKGAREVRKFLEGDRVDRVILLSDGLANVGPSSPAEMADLGASLVKEGISVTTIGLGTGYNEDLMAALARTSDGNHAFAENATDLARIFNHEFGDLLSVIAGEVRLTIRCGDGVRPIRVLGRDADIHGQTVEARLNQLYAGQEKYLMLEVEVPASVEGTRREIASVSVDYANTLTRQRERLSDSASISFSGSRAAVEGSQNHKVQIASVELISNEANRRAVELRDKGEIQKARTALESNAEFLEKKAKKYKSKRLQKLSKDNKKDMSNMAGPEWKTQRKVMRARQHSLDLQQAW